MNDAPSEKGCVCTIRVVSRKFQDLRHNRNVPNPHKVSPFDVCQIINQQVWKDVLHHLVRRGENWGRKTCGCFTVTMHLNTLLWAPDSSWPWRIMKHLSNLSTYLTCLRVITYLTCLRAIRCSFPRSMGSLRHGRHQEGRDNRAAEDSGRLLPGLHEGTAEKARNVHTTPGGFICRGTTFNFSSQDLKYIFCKTTPGTSPIHFRSFLNHIIPILCFKVAQLGHVSWQRKWGWGHEVGSWRLESGLVNVLSHKHSRWMNYTHLKVPLFYFKLRSMKRQMFHFQLFDSIWNHHI